MAVNPHVVTIADTTERLIKDRAERAHAAAAAHDVDGLSYPAIAREAYLLLAQRGLAAEVIDGAGIGSDNLRKMVAAVT